MSTRSSTSAPRWRRMIRVAAIAAAVLIVGGGTLEATARVVQRNRLPWVPYRFEGGATVMPANADLTVWFRGYPPNRYVTDAGGARVADPARAATRPEGEVLAVGDSQALGYMLDFDDTFASRVAARVLGDPRAARMLATPASTPESFVPAIQRYAAGGLARQRLVIVTLNLGNDLDELYLEARGYLREPAGPLRQWLMLHSFLYMEAKLGLARLDTRDEVAPGVSPILYMLDAGERVALARATARAIGRLPAMVPADRAVIVVVPQDVQVNPDELLKMRRYYRDQADFALWSERRGSVARVMNTLEDFISAQLTAQGHRLIRVSELARTYRGREPLFSDTSHHLTAAGNALVAEAIAAVMTERKP